MEPTSSTPLSWPETLAAIQRDAEDKFPFECCGVLTACGKVIACENVAGNRATAFRIGPGEMQRLEKRYTLAGVYHSHITGGSTPSLADKLGGAVPGLYIIARLGKGRVTDVRVYGVSVTKSGNCFVPLKEPPQWPMTASTTI